jgi:hypothetical protein
MTRVLVGLRGGALPAAVAVISLFLGGIGPPAAQDLKRPEEQLAAIYSLRVQLEIEQRRLDDALQTYNDRAAARDAAAARASRLNRELDDMIAGQVPADPDEVLAKEEEVQKTEQEYEALIRATHEIRTQIRDAHVRIILLSDRIARLRKTLPSDNESLTGAWDVVYLPSSDKGIFTLRQSGTLLVGEYSLEGGWKGSLQGTFVDNKVLLHRIDSKLGRSSDLEGTVAADGKTIRGTWQNFILSGGQPTNGSWVAKKRQERPETD